MNPLNKFRVRETFACEHDGKSYVFRAGELLAADHPVAVVQAAYFEPMRPGDPELRVEDIHISEGEARERYGELLDVAATSALLGVSEKTVRRWLREFKLPGIKVAAGTPKAQWRVVKSALERRMAADAHRARVREAGVVVGHDDDAFDREIERVHGRQTMEQVRAVRERHELLQEAARAVSGDPDLRRAFETLDADEVIERTAHEIANRVRREERIRNRAAQILADDDDEHDR